MIIKEREIASVNKKKKRKNDYSLIHGKNLREMKKYFENAKNMIINNNKILTLEEVLNYKIDFNKLNNKH